MADEIISDLSHMGSLTAAITFMLAEAADLPDPESVTVYGILSGHVHDEVSLQFAAQAESTEAIVLWAQRFGGVIESKSLDFGDGTKQLVRAKFTWQGFLSVDAFVIFPLLDPEAITSSEQDSVPETVTPF
jgi:hypothetical protein